MEIGYCAIVLLLAFSIFCFQCSSQKIDPKNSTVFISQSNHTSEVHRKLLINNDAFEFTTTAVDYYAKMKGLKLQPTSQGIFLTLEAYPAEGDVKIGYLHTFLRPLPKDTLHLETIQVRTKRQTFESSKKAAWSPESGLIAFIMSSWALCWGREKGSKRAELVALSESPELNKILVKLYSSFGFQVTREIGDGPGVDPDEVVWGGKGTLMTLDMDKFFDEWSSKFRFMIRREEQRQRKRLQQQLSSSEASSS